MKPEPLPASLPLLEGDLWVARLRHAARPWMRRHQRGAVLAPQGRALDAVHVVTSGLLSLTISSPSGRTAVVGLLGPGAVAGEASLLGPVGAASAHPATATGWFDFPEVRAATPCCTLGLPAADLARAVGADPSLAGWLAGALAARIRTLERSLARALSLPVRDRLLDLLCELADSHGVPIDGGVKIPVPLCQEDLGALVGATRESVNRALRELERSGLTWRRGGRYVVAGVPADRAGAQVPGVS